MGCRMKQLNGVSIITPTIRRSCINRIINNYINQEFEIKELIVIINNDDISIEEYEKYIKKYPGISVYKLKQITSLGECLNFAITKAKYDIIAKLDDDDYYSKFYIREMYNAFNAGGDIVGKQKINCYIEELKELRVYSWGQENQYVKWISGPTICFKKEIFSLVKFRDIPCAVDKYFIEDCLKLKLKIYSTSTNNFILYRGIDSQQHTWKVTVDYFLKSTNKVKSNINFEESYNCVDKFI